MSIGSLVAIPELQLEGPARCLGLQAGYMKLQFLASGAEMTQESRRVVRYVLFPGTKVRVGEQWWTLGADAPKQEKGLISYAAIDEAGQQGVLSETEVEELATADDPIDHLSQLQWHDLRARFGKAGSPAPAEAWGPRTVMARESLLTWRDQAWQRSGGVVGLAGARVIPLPHQILAARRMLADREVRFLLADEVGLGKTIEAGLVMQSLLAMEPRLRVLILVPGSLLSQWFVELHVKFGGRDFKMLDARRLEEWGTNEGEVGSPFASGAVICSTTALEQLDPIRQAQFDSVRLGLSHR